jgi:hypothetical protein
MYIKFKVKDGGQADGGFGLLGAVDWAMTSAASNTASAPSFTGSFLNEIQDLIVVANDEAGGWTNYSTISSSSANHSWSGGWQAPSPKTGRDFKKRFSIRSQSSISSHYSNWAPAFSAYDDDRNSNILNETNLSFIKNSGTTATQNAFFSNRSPKDQSTYGYWNLSVTSKYVYLWPDSGPNTPTGQRFLAGVADLSGTPQYLLNAISDNFASVGFYTSGSDNSGASGTSTTTYWNDYVSYYFAGIDGAGPNSVTSTTGTPITESAANPSINFNGLPWIIAPTHYFNVINQAQEQHSPIFDEWGSPIGSLTPITITNPLRGIPTQYVEGIYYYGAQRILDATQALEWSNNGASKYNNRIIYDERGDKYVLWHQYGSMHIKAIRAM